VIDARGPVIPLDAADRITAFRPSTTARKVWHLLADRGAERTSYRFYGSAAGLMDWLRVAGAKAVEIRIEPKATRARAA